MPLDRAAMHAAYALPDRDTARVRVNFVSSLDGHRTVGGRSGGLGGDDDRLVMGVLRAMADVVVVGAGTVRVEGYGGVRLARENVDWRRAHGLAPRVPLAVVSASLDLDPRHPFFARATERPLVIAPESAPAERRAALAEVAEVLVCGEASVDPRSMIDALGERGMTQLLSEGGPHLFGDLVAADAVDELCLTLSPSLVGGEAGRIVRGAPEATRRMRLVHAIPSEDFVFLRYAARR
jgi:riboflavin biosynthesis pyrimidine reductase